MSSYDVYGETERIACLLDSSDHPEASDAMRNAIASGSTATEILMALRHAVSSAAGAFRGTYLEAELRTLHEQVSALLDS